MHTTKDVIERISRGTEEFGVLRYCVEATYMEHYRATIAVNPKEFIGLRTSPAQGGWGACFGVTYAGEGPLFSERYLGQSCEQHLKKLLHVSLDRSRLAECGSFASMGAPGSGKTLLMSLPWILWTSGIDYALVTVTPQVQHLFRNLKIPFVPACNANRDVLTPQEKEIWGTYYECSPLTGYIDIRQAVVNSIDRKIGPYAISSLMAFPHQQAA